MAQKAGIAAYTSKNYTPPADTGIEHAVHRRPGQLDRQWFVLLIEPNCERRASAFLTARRFKTYVPEMAKLTFRGCRHKRTYIRRPIFPGYVFLFFGFAADSDRRQFVETAPGVHKFLKFDEHYAALPAGWVEAFSKIEQELLIPKKVQGPAAMFAPGEKVSLTIGPFAGLRASIQTLDDDERVTILLDLLGRAVRAQVSAEQLEKL